MSQALFDHPRFFSRMYECFLKKVYKSSRKPWCHTFVTKLTSLPNQPLWTWSRCGHTIKWPVELWTVWMRGKTKRMFTNMSASIVFFCPVFDVGPLSFLSTRRMISNHFYESFLKTYIKHLSDRFPFGSLSQQTTLSAWIELSFDFRHMHPTSLFFFFMPFAALEPFF